SKRCVAAPPNGVRRCWRRPGPMPKRSWPRPARSWRLTRPKHARRSSATRRPSEPPSPTGSPAGRHTEGSESTVRSAFAFACEMLNKLRSLGTALAVVSLCLGLTAGAALAQEPPATPAAGAAQADDAHEPVGHDAPGAVIEEGHAADAAHDADAHGADEAHGEEHHESIWTTIARVANFALLAGGLFYFLREPISQHLESRGTQIRNDLETAARVKAEAAARLAEI